MKRWTVLRRPSLEVGQGALEGLPQLLAGDGHESVMLVTGGRSVRGRDQWAGLLDGLMERGIEPAEGTVRGEPSAALVDALAAQLDDDGIEVSAVVAIGGGSAMDAGKALAALLGMRRAGEELDSIERCLEGVGDRLPSGETLPVYAVPTTAGTGTEATHNAVLSRVGSDGYKKSLRHRALVPYHVIIDPDLHLDCPESVTRASGLDAVVQLAEAWWSTGANPGVESDALLGLAEARHSLERLLAGEDSASLRASMSMAAFRSGVCLSNAGLGVIHGVAGPLGSLRDIPHGVACGLLAAPAIERTLTIAHADSSAQGRATISRMAEAARALGVAGAPAGAPAPDDDDDAVDMLAAWFRRLASPFGRLRDYGFDSSALDRAVEISSAKSHPVPMGPEDFRAILEGIA